MVLRQVIEAIPALNKLANAELDIKAAYRVSKIISALQSEVEFFNAKRRQIVEKHGKVNEDDTVSYEPGKQAEADKELKELISLEIQAEIEPIEVSAGDIRLTANDILALEPFVKFKFE